MFTLGFTEIIVIIIVVIIVIKPEDLPKFFKKMGRFYGEAKKSYGDINKIKDDFIKIAEIDDIETEKILKKPIKTLKK